MNAVEEHGVTLAVEVGPCKVVKAGFHESLGPHTDGGPDWPTPPGTRIRRQSPEEYDNGSQLSWLCKDTDNLRIDSRLERNRWDTSCFF